MKNLLIHHEVFSEVHPTKNNINNLDKITVGSKKSIWWLCSKGHEWEAIVSNRTKLKATGCGYCSGRHAVPGESDAFTLHPEIIPYVISPNELKTLRPKSNVRVGCRCPVDGYEWRPKLSELVAGTRCPVCSNNVVVRGINDLWTTHPHMASQLVDNKIGYTICKGSNIKQDFVCRKGHITSKTPTQRPDDSKDCVRCSHHTSKAEKTLAKIFREKGYKVTPQFSRGPLRRVDILLDIKGLEVGIEYDGAYYHQFKYEEDVLKTETSLKELDLSVRIREYNKRYPLYNLPSDERYLELSTKDKTLGELAEEIIVWSTSHGIINKE